jgi:CRISPR-associated endonuclease/helicase Cas3
MRMVGQELVFRYWGKARDSEQNRAPYHLLVYHALDVAAVANIWWQQSSVLRQRLCLATGLDEVQTHAWTLFFIALHDYGKWDIRFQLKAPEALKALFPEFEPDMAEPDRHYYHGPGGYAWFFREDAGHLGLSYEQWSRWQPWLQAVTGHHGDLPDSAEAAEPLAEAFIIDRDRQARLEWLQMLETLFLQPVELDLQSLVPSCPDMLAGFCSVCDWLGSNDQHFCYKTRVYSLPAYWERACVKARQAFAESGLYRAVMGIGGMEQLFPDKRPRQLQTLVDALPVEPGLTMVEAPTGSGKTEMALAYASKLLAEGVAESVVFALPTQATANAMLRRLEEVAGKLFADGPSVVLAHGKARYNPNFEALKQAAQRPTVQAKDTEGDASVQCIQWLGASRKRAFLGQIGVCTVDQVLLSVLPVRHQFVRAFGVRKSVLIIDEVHAYDAYMYGLLSQVLGGQRLAGGSVLLLSATLPLQQKELLASAWGGDLPPTDDPETASYPLITRVSHENQATPYELPEETKSAPRQEDEPAPPQVRIERHIAPGLLPNNALCQRMIDAAEQGALVGVVCNLVAVAQDLAGKLRAMTSMPVDLFHARFRFEDRQNHELNAIARYGNGQDRSRGRILVATQVIEQSLDLDFDWLLSQLCPVDLLFQRLGRLHRHVRSGRPVSFEQPCCTLLLPADDDYGLHAVVYSYKRVLWRTQQMLMRHDVIMFPEAYRQWIERVYQAEPWADEPEAITTGYEKFALCDQGRFFCARQLSKSDATPWPDTEGAASRLTRDGDSTFNVLLVQDTPLGLALLSGKPITELSHDQRDEELDLNTVSVPKSWTKWLDTHKDGDYRLVLQATTEGVWEAERNGKRFHYSQELGLRMFE